MTAFADDGAASRKVGLGKVRCSRGLHTSTSPWPFAHRLQGRPKDQSTVPVWSRDPRRASSRRRPVPLSPWGAHRPLATGPHGHVLRAGLPQLADKALRLALRVRQSVRPGGHTRRSRSYAGTSTLAFPTWRGGCPYTRSPSARGCRVCVGMGALLDTAVISASCAFRSAWSACCSGLCLSAAGPAALWGCPWERRALSWARRVCTCSAYCDSTSRVTCAGIHDRCLRHDRVGKLGDGLQTRRTDPQVVLERAMTR